MCCIMPRSARSLSQHAYPASHYGGLPRGLQEPQQAEQDPSSATRGGQSVSAWALTLTDCVQFADGKNTRNLDKPSLRAAFIERNAPRNLGRVLMSIFSVFARFYFVGPG